MPFIGRRKFLQLSAFTAPLLALKPSSNSNNQSIINNPIIISTWDEGKNVNAAEWNTLKTKGRALDAIEVGAIYIEDKISCCVGLGAYPNRDGIFTLDACIMDEFSNCSAVAGIEQIKHP